MQVTLKVLNYIAQHDHCTFGDIVRDTRLSRYNINQAIQALAFWKLATLTYKDGECGYQLCSGVTLQELRSLGLGVKFVPSKHKVSDDTSKVLNYIAQHEGCSFRAIVRGTRLSQDRTHEAVSELECEGEVVWQEVGLMSVKYFLYLDASFQDLRDLDLDVKFVSPTQE